MSLAHSLNVRLIGQGTDTLILSHGFGTNQKIWDRLLPHLAEKYRVLVYDLPCAGTAAGDMFDARRHTNLDGYVDDLLQVMNEMRVARCTYIGHSVSGMIGLLAAQRSPQRFQQLILIGASPHYLNDGPYKGGLDRDGVAQIFDAISNAFQTWAKSYAPIVLKRPLDHPATQEFAASLLAMRPDIALLTAKTIFLSDLRDRLADCTIPTVILQTRDDPAVPAEVAGFLHAHIRNSALDILNTTGHLPHLSDPELVAQALHRHLALFVEA